MDPEQFERVHAAFLAFHAEFAPHLGRKQWRERSRDHLQVARARAANIQMADVHAFER
jgi:hypothetical protein